jgi:hypothetical protein
LPRRCAPCGCRRPFRSPRTRAPRGCCCSDVSRWRTATLRPGGARTQWAVGALQRVGGGADATPAPPR